MSLELNLSRAISAVLWTVVGIRRLRGEERSYLLASQREVIHVHEQDHVFVLFIIKSNSKIVEEQLDIELRLALGGLGLDSNLQVKRLH